MELVLREVQREETKMINQATLEGKKEVEYVFLANRSKRVAHNLVVSQRCNAVNAKNSAMWCLIAKDAKNSAMWCLIAMNR